MIIYRLIGVGQSLIFMQVIPLQTTAEGLWPKKVFVAWGPMTKGLRVGVIEGLNVKTLWHEEYPSMEDAFEDLIEHKDLLLPKRLIDCYDDYKYWDVLGKLRSAAGLE